MINRLSFTALILFFACHVSGQSLQDVSLWGRWVNLTASPPAFYSADFTVTFYVHTNMNTQFLVDAPDVQEMADIWNNVSGTFINFDIQGGATGYPIINHEVPPINVIGADKSDPSQAEYYDYNFNPNRKNRNKLGFTKRHTPTVDCNNWWHPVILGCDIIFNSQAPLAILHPGECNDPNVNKYDIKTCLLHELGHAAGLNHHPNENSSDVMYGKIAPAECNRTSLQPIDEYAIIRLYSQDIDQTSSISCATFVQPNPVEELVAEPWEPPDEPNICCSFCDDHITIDKDYENKTKVKRAAKSITADVVTVKDNSNITFIAGEYLVFLDGFEVEEGSVFEAIIDPVECKKPIWCPGGIQCWGGASKRSDDSSDVYSDTTDLLNEKEKVVDLGDHGNNNIIILSNPTNSLVIITGNHYSFISVSNLLGKIIFTSTVYAQKSIIDLSSHSPGLYFVKVVTDENVYVEKIILQ